jgi:Na+-transporting NADH:ubiquinone oxidoreductase subunit NqrB
MSEQNPNVTVFTILRSALAGLVGIQKKENLKRDFESGRFWHFFIAGAIVTLLFMAGVWLAVSTMMAQA